VRIVGGRLKGLRLAEPGEGDAEAHLRPTADRVRESIFDVLASGYAAPGAGSHVLDLFAGTGALGLEALSRGAGFATFVDSGRKAGALIRDNIQRARAADACRTIARDAARIGRCPGRPAGLVFLDPPYGEHLGARALVAAHAGGWLGPGALVVWEEATPQEPPRGFELQETRRYGDTHVTFLTRAREA